MGSTLEAGHLLNNLVNQTTSKPFHSWRT